MPLSPGRQRKVTAPGVRVGEEKEAAIRACLADGFGLIRTAKTVGVGVSVVQRVRAQQ
jgi:hypothetical protein